MEDDAEYINIEKVVKITVGILFKVVHYSNGYRLNRFAGGFFFI